MARFVAPKRSERCPDPLGESFFLRRRQYHTQHPHPTPVQTGRTAPRTPLVDHHQAVTVGLATCWSLAGRVAGVGGRLSAPSLKVWHLQVSLDVRGSALTLEARAIGAIAIASAAPLSGGRDDRCS